MNFDIIILGCMALIIILLVAVVFRLADKHDKLVTVFKNYIDLERENWLSQVEINKVVASKIGLDMEVRSQKVEVTEGV